MDEFKLFAKLPIELRLRIWRLAPSRVVRIDPIADSERESIEDFLEDSERAKLNYREDDTLLSSTKTPVLFHICRESRSEGMKIYKLCFTHLLTPIWFNCQRDTLWFWDAVTLEAFTCHSKSWAEDATEAEVDIKSIKKIAINTFSNDRTGRNVALHSDMLFFQALKKLTGLEETEIVVRGGNVRFSIQAEGFLGERKFVEMEASAGSTGNDITFNTQHNGPVTIPKVRAISYAAIKKLSLL
jgi:hypothetical protein